jgi:hypothetical protein
MITPRLQSFCFGKRTGFCGSSGYRPRCSDVLSASPSKKSPGSLNEYRGFEIGLPVPRPVGRGLVPGRDGLRRRSTRWETLAHGSSQ